MKQNSLPPADGVPFLEVCERESLDGNADFIEHNLPQIERCISQIMDRQKQLADIEYRFRTVVLQHEPPAEKRTPAH